MFLSVGRRCCARPRLCFERATRASPCIIASVAATPVSATAISSSSAAAVSSSAAATVSSSASPSAAGAITAGAISLAIVSAAERSSAAALLPPAAAKVASHLLEPLGNFSLSVFNEHIEQITGDIFVAVVKHGDSNALVSCPSCTTNPGT